jgi:outer membrane immunogenic protein
MRSVFIGSAVACALASASYAADMPIKAPQMVQTQAVSTWTGFYLGLHGGYAWGDSTATAVTGNANFPVGSTVSSGHPEGGLFGAQVGYNYQISQWLIGLEGDYSIADISSTESTTTAIGNTNTSSGKHKWLADVTGRLGYVVMPDLLLYFKGGWAWTHNDASSTLTSPAGVVLSTSTGSEDRDGFLVGGGVEYAFLPHWSAKLEYNYMDFGTTTVTRVSNTGTTSLRDSKLNLNVFKAGINYRF